MAVAYNTVTIASLSEANVNARGTSQGWGDSWVLASGGLQNDITLIAQKFDDWKANGITPDASGIADFGSATLPLDQVYADSFVSGTPLSSGGIFVYGDTNAAAALDFQLYRLEVNGGALQATPVGAVGQGNGGS